MKRSLPNNERTEGAKDLEQSVEERSPGNVLVPDQNKAVESEKGRQETPDRNLGSGEKSRKKKRGGRQEEFKKARGAQKKKDASQGRQLSNSNKKRVGGHEKLDVITALLGERRAGRYPRGGGRGPAAMEAGIGAMQTEEKRKKIQESFVSKFQPENPKRRGARPHHRPKGKGSS